MSKKRSDGEGPKLDDLISGQGDADESVCSREELAQELSRRLRDPRTPPAYIPGLAGRLSEIQGYSRAKEQGSRERSRSIAELMNAWRAERVDKWREGGGSCPTCGQRSEPPVAPE